MRIEIFRDLKNVKPFWEELNQSYRKKELCYDFTLHERLSSLYSYQASQILVGFDGSQCVGIIPFVCDNSYNNWDLLGDRHIISHEYFCVPSFLSEFIPHFPPHETFDMNFEYLVPYFSQKYFARMPACIVELKPSFKSFIQSYPLHRAKSFLKCLKDNEDLNLRVSFSVLPEVYPLFHHYLEHWNKKDLDEGLSGDEKSSLKIENDFQCILRADEMKKLIALHIYKEDRLIAVNFSVGRGSKRVDDYLCIRDTTGEFKKRGLGHFAILKNMELAISLGVSLYDLSAGDQPYKARYCNTSFTYFAFAKLAEHAPISALLGWTAPIMVENQLFETQQQWNHYIQGRIDASQVSTDQGCDPSGGI